VVRDEEIEGGREGGTEGGRGVTYLQAVIIAGRSQCCSSLFHEAVLQWRERRKTREGGREGGEGCDVPAGRHHCREEPVLLFPLPGGTVLQW